MIVHLHLPLEQWLILTYRLDVKNFERSLAGRKDSGFLTFGQLCQFIRKLCYRSLLPAFVPAVTEWSAVLDLSGRELKQLSSPVFIFRLKMKSDLDGACRIKARRDLSDKVPGSLDSLVEAAKEEFSVQARQFIVSLIEGSAGRYPSQCRYRSGYGLL